MALCSAPPRLVATQPALPSAPAPLESRPHQRSRASQTPGLAAQYRSWSRITSGVLLDVIGAVQYGTSRVFYKIVPPFDANEFRQYIHQVMRIFGPTGKKVVIWWSIVVACTVPAN
jgi:hypothetical protein